MKYPALLLAPLALLLTVAPQAQKGGTKVTIVNVQKVMEAAPGGSEIAALRKKADADLAAQAKKLQDLQAKATTAAGRQALQAATATFTSAQQKYQKQLADRSKPLAGTIDKAVTAAAKANGASIVLDYAVAQQSGLVIYADTKRADMTDAVVKQIRK